MVNPDKCIRCGRFVGATPARVIPIRHDIHPYAADYKYLCRACAEGDDK